MADTNAQELRDRPIGELMKQLAQETSTLVRQELQLARVEATEKGRKAGVGIGLMGAAGVAGLLTLGTLTAFLVLALDGAMPAWLAALLVGLGWAIVGAALALVGRERVQEVGRPVPEQTIETVKEDVEWAKTRLRSDET